MFPQAATFSLTQGILQAWLQRIFSSLRLYFSVSILILQLWRQMTWAKYLQSLFVEKVQTMALNQDTRIVLFTLCNTKAVQVIGYKFLRKQYPRIQAYSVYLKKQRIQRNDFFLNCCQLKERTGSWKKELAVKRKDGVMQLPQPAANLCENRLSCN